MFFVNLINLIDGVLKNIPSISAFNSIVFEPKKVKLGDLFIGEKEDIVEAVKNGAYGVVSTEFDITDNEIAWIKVESLKDAKEKLLRYFVVKNSSKIIYLNSVDIRILESIQESNKNIIFIENNIEESIIRFSNIDDENIVAVFKNREFFKKLDIKESITEYEENIHILSSTLFLTTFVYKDKIYHDVKLPKIFLPNLNKIISILNFIGIKYNINKLNFINHFKPFFVDRYFSLLPFGHSSKVIIMENDISLLNQEIEYLKNNATWTKFALILPEELSYNVDDSIDIDILRYKNIKDFIKIDYSRYNFILTFDDKQKIENYIMQKSQEKKDTLF